MARKYLLMAIVAVWAAGMGTCPADVWDLPENWPIIEADGLGVDYDAQNKLFTAIGAAYELDLSSSSSYIPIWHDSSMTLGEEGLFNLTATIDNTGKASGGLLEIYGWVEDMSGGTDSRLLLSASVTDFGYFYIPAYSYFDESFEMWEPGYIGFGFAGSVQGGELASDFGGLDAPVGVWMGMETWRTTLDFNSDFSEPNGGAAAGGAVTFSVVPAPSSGLLLLLMTGGNVLFGVIVRARRR